MSPPSLMVGSRTPVTVHRRLETRGRLGTVEDWEPWTTGNCGSAATVHSCTDMLTTRLGKRPLRGLSSAQGSSDIITMATSSAGPPPGAQLCPGSRAMSSSISVPSSHTRPHEVDMDELMAAMVLSSLSCSPLPHGPAHSHTASMNDGECGEPSEDNSDRWGVCHGKGSPTPSPSIEEVPSSLATPPNEGTYMDLDQAPSDEPAVRKRRSSERTAFRCLWPCCSKTLTSLVGIKRHIRTTHLRHATEHERSDEDFYYTEINHWEPPHSLPVCCGPTPTSSSSPPSPSLPPSPPPPSPPSPTSGALSRSAPSSSGIFWQVQSEHSYQAPPPGHVTSTPHDQYHTMTPPNSTQTLGSGGRARSMSVGEQWLQQHSAPCRRPRGEAKKCRKVYGVEHRERWCTACRWKKACQRFTD